VDVVDAPELKLYVAVERLVLVALARRSVGHRVDLTTSVTMQDNCR